MFENVTLNGRQLTPSVVGTLLHGTRKADPKLLDRAKADEKFLVSHSRSTGSATRIRNHSGGRTSKGRVIFSAAMGGWQ